jgi:hypothetical protein
VNRLVTGIGVASILLGAVVLAIGVPGDERTIVAAAVALLAIFGVVSTLWKLLATPGADGTVLPPPWTDDGELFGRKPERSRGEDALSGESFGAVLSEACDRARSAGTVEAGYETVRPVLRRVLVDALVLRDGDRVAVERSLAGGEWTDDRTAAAILDPAVEPPPLSLRERIEAWLFPERVVRRQLQVAVQEIAEAADEVVPTVPGQNAPRSVPISQPRLADLQRGVDGSLQRAVDPLATARGPRPPGSEARDVDVSVSENGEEPTDTGDDSVGEPTDDSADDLEGGASTSRETEDRDLFATDGGER